MSSNHSEVPERAEGTVQVKTSEQLRKVVLEIRRKPYPIKDLIPLLDKAATELEKYEGRVL